MKKMIRLATAGAVLAAAASLTTVAHAATEEVGASAEILSALDITEEDSLDFASIAVNGAGTVVVATGAGLDSCSVLIICAGTKTPALFTVNGAAGLSIDATVQEGSITLSNGTDTMLVDTFTIGYVPSSTLVGGTTQFEVGATLHVAAAQPVGVYTGLFNVDVIYN